MNIDAPRDPAALRALWKQAFGDEDTFLNSFFDLGFSRSRCRCVTIEGKLAAAAYWFDVSEGGKKLAYLYAVATEESFRGRGICHKLMDHIHGLLREQDYDGAILVPGSEDLFRFYGSMGYKSFGSLDKQVCRPGGPDVKLRQIGQAEYARLRRQRLPAGGVVQEGAMLDMLATQVRFYAGEDNLLCASKRDGLAVIPEYLGDRKWLPGVVAALGAQQAAVRLPGGDTPFAMYLPLSAKGEKAPGYFALALD